VIVTSGGVVSTVNVFAELNPVFPASSDCRDRAVYVPSSSDADACTLYAPSGLAVVVSVWIGAPDVPEPEYRSTVTDRRSPEAVPAVPLNDG
jgi:hypothetical protein